MYDAKDGSLISALPLENGSRSIYARTTTKGEQVVFFRVDYEIEENIYSFGSEQVSYIVQSPTSPDGWYNHEISGTSIYINASVANKKAGGSKDPYTFKYLLENVADDAEIELWLASVNAHYLSNPAINLPFVTAEKYSADNYYYDYTQHRLSTIKVKLENGQVDVVYHVFDGKQSNKLQDTTVTLRFTTAEEEFYSSDTLTKIDIQKNSGDKAQFENNKKPIFSRKAYVVEPYGVTEAQLTLTFDADIVDKVSVDGGKPQSLSSKKLDVTLSVSPKGISHTIQPVATSGKNAGKPYSIVCVSKNYTLLPDKVTDYLCIGSQYTNGMFSYGGRGLLSTVGSNTTANLIGPRGPVSLGNFGGYITYYYETPITNDEKNPYGIDFIIFGNSYFPHSGYAEPGQVWVSEDGKTWYALAGSLHYDDSTIWNYTVIYRKNTNGKTDWSDNYNHSGTLTHSYIVPDYYGWHTFAKGYSYQDELKGIFLCQSEEENEFGNTLPPFPLFGYADVGMRGTIFPGENINQEENEETGELQNQAALLARNIAGNPYLGTEKQDIHDCLTVTDGMDLAWAVNDETGLPIDVSKMQFHYVKIQTATLIDNGSIGEKSTEINMMRIAQPATNDAGEPVNVGQTAAPTALTIDGQSVEVGDTGAVYDMTVSGPFSVEVTAPKSANVFINGERTTSWKFDGILVHGIVRVIVQEGQKAPWIGYLKLIKGDDVTTYSLTFVDGTKTTTGVYDDQLDGYALPVPTTSSTNKVFAGWRYGINTFTTFDKTAIPDGAELTAVWNTTDGGGTAEDITVSFRLIGSSRSSADVDLSTGNYNGAVYQTWIPTDEYTITTANTVLDLIKTAADAAGVTYEDTGNYIKSVTAPEAFGATKLTAMDNGPKSGWMYTVNGEHGLLGISQQTLANGDSVVFHYVDDYSYEVADWDRLGGTGYPAQSVSTYHNAWLKAVDKVTLSESELVLTLGETESADLTATVTPADAVYDTLTWASSKDTVATVANGKVTAVAAGTADITATAGGITGTCKVTVKEPDTVLAESVTLNKSELGLTVGGNEKLTATVLPKNTTDKTVVWTSSKDSVATVSSDGTVTAVSVGDAVITATCGAKSDECTVTVTAAPGTVTEVQLNKSTLPLTVGDTETLIATVIPSGDGVTVNWSSSAKNIATVDDGGKVTAVAPGPATITAEADGKSATCEVTVLAKVTFDDSVLGKTAEYVYKTVTEPTLKQVGGEWAVLGLARSGYDVPEAYYQGYYARLVEAVRNENGDLGRGYTEYSRVILALTALGKDPASVGGYDLLSRLGDYDKTIWQGNNGPIFALIALDAGIYEIPTNADAATQATRQKYVDLLLQNQLDDGGWTLDSTGGAGSSAVDYTAMALQALAKYKDQPAVAAAIEKGLARLSELQNDDGGFSFGSEGATSESSSQVIVALGELGISLDDARFVKNGKTVLDALLMFRNDDGSFKHVASQTGADQMATEQALYALVSVDRAEKGKPTLYTMTDHLNISGDGAAIPVTGIALNQNEVGVEEGKTVTLTATVTPSNATSKAVTWSSSAPSVATVKDGMITGVKAGTATITAKAGDKAAECTVTVTAASGGGGGTTPKDETITVSFRLIGAEKSAQDVDLGSTAYLPDYVTWVTTSYYTLDKGATVYDLWTEAMSDAGIRSVGAEDNYVKTVYAPDDLGGYALSQFTNGPRSGWMYTVNGAHPGFGLTEKTLSDGDAVIWHYVNDYSYEVDDWASLGGTNWPALGDGTYYSRWLMAADSFGAKGGGIPLGGGTTGGGTTDGTGDKTDTGGTTDTDIKATEVTVTPEVTDGEAKAEVSADTVAEALKESEDADVLTITVDTTDADKVEATLGADAVKAAAEADVDLHVETEVGTIKVDSNTLNELADSGKDIAVTVTANDDGTTTLNVTVDGESVDAKVKVELPAADEGQVLVIVNTDGTETVVKKSLVEDGKAYAEIPAGATVKVVEGESIEFGDVADSAWYAEAVEFVASHELFQGTDNGFEPETTMNRAMLAMVLYRLEDATATGNSYFPDVSDDAWYAEAVAWASETGIVNGTDKGFEPNAPVTREQIATMLYRYANVIGLDTGTRGELSSFPDGDETSSWAQDAMAWAVSVGLFQGDDTGALNPKGDATRAQVATLFERMIGLIVK